MTITRDIRLGQLVGLSARSREVAVHLAQFYKIPWSEVLEAADLLADEVSMATQMLNQENEHRQAEADVFIDMTRKGQ